MSNGQLLYIKKIKPDSDELQLLQYLSSPEQLQDPQNHCVPLLDVIHDPSDPQTCFVVMPYLRYIDHPPLEFVEDLLECGEQILEVSAPAPTFLIPSLTRTAGACLPARPWRGSPVSIRCAMDLNEPLLTRFHAVTAPTRTS